MHLLSRWSRSPDAPSGDQDHWSQSPDAPSVEQDHDLGHQMVHPVTEISVPAHGMHLLSRWSRSPDGPSGEQDHDLGYQMPSGDRDHPVEQGYSMIYLVDALALPDDLGHWMHNPVSRIMISVTGWHPVSESLCLADTQTIWWPNLARLLGTGKRDHYCSMIFNLKSCSEQRSTKYMPWLRHPMTCLTFNRLQSLMVGVEKNYGRIT